eukprot:CAMPEP_0197628166 /NCGR_PEP_ID=MMETSP1338-20131121/6571_1 /TAXON_ID=43686 ORGANISM="Pelagodinium beii, Strain RCC1491" /NCGR_SAMPLE_ID=MMETSP1338 /ASSEMBLY_ACC=CAM_ASM_000754 /LENGTH=200 /DNA_ID=CAMNT_0043199095 /DNA_START=41 /DNA_END=643 /DNA_ORIENTATION=+
MVPSLALVLISLPLASAKSGVMSIMGKELGYCSQPGTAMTGFTRDGKCGDVGPADAGAHHVCIQMKSDFCTVTGQPNWCTTRTFPCMGKAGQCSIGNWCVCQWAFARYLERAGGCDSIVDLVCDATNMAAFEAYSRSNRPEHVAALECIKKKCGFVNDGAEVESQVEGEVDVVKGIILDSNMTCGGSGKEKDNDSQACKA